MNSYDKGDLVRISAAFTNVSSVATDPSTIVCRVRRPQGSITLYTYGTDAALVKSGTGNYYVDLTTDQSGVWYYRFEGTGAVVQAEEDSFFVEVSQF